MVAALGVVFGDIGTSPLYAMKTMLHEAGSIDRTAVYGVTSLVIWTLVLIVSVLFVGILLRADNEGEGGPLALVALVRRSTTSSRVAVFAGVVGMAGVAMFLGDSVITPAISVLSAAEGLEVASPSLKVLVLPIAVVILVGIFVVQRIGSGRIGKVYGPVMCVWFGVLAAGGIASLVQTPEALQALSPIWAVRFVLDDPMIGFLTLGAVILAVTGAEALYADLGHFGRQPIARAWLLLVLPALVLAYLGEAGAIVRDGSTAAANPFYAVVPGWATIPVLVIATHGNGDRLRGSDRRRVHAAAPGRRHGVLPLPAHRAHLARGGRPDLPARGQLGPRRSRAGRRRPLPRLPAPLRGVRHRGERDLPGHRRALPPAAERAEPRPSGPSHRARLLPLGRARVLRRHGAEGASPAAGCRSPSGSSFSW